MSKNYTSNKSQGFSLPELLIVVLIIGILTVIAIPSISRTMQLRRLDTVVSEIADKMTDARMYAIKRNRAAWLLLDPVNRTTQMQTTDDAGNTINLKPAERLPGGLNLTASGVVECRFDSMGRLAAGSLTVTFQTGTGGSAKSKSITVAPAGKITVGKML